MNKAKLLNNKGSKPTCKNKDENSLQYSPAEIKGPNNAPKSIKVLASLVLPIISTIIQNKKFKHNKIIVTDLFLLKVA